MPRCSRASVEGTCGRDAGERRSALRRQMAYEPSSTLQGRQRPRAQRHRVPSARPAEGYAPDSPTIDVDGRTADAMAARGDGRKATTSANSSGLPMREDARVAAPAPPESPPAAAFCALLLAALNHAHEHGIHADVARPKLLDSAFMSAMPAARVTEQRGLRTRLLRRSTSTLTMDPPPRRAQVRAAHGATRARPRTT